MRPHLLRTAGFLLTISPATLAAAVALTAGRTVVAHVAPAVVVSLALFATASLLSGGIDWTLLIGIASIGLVLAAARSRPVMTKEQSSSVWQGAVIGLYVLAVLAALQVSPVARPLFAALDAFLEPVLGRFGLALDLWPLELPGRASLWALHPNTLGASVLVPALAAMTLRAGPAAHLVVLAPALALVALTGSRSALLGLAVGVVVLLVADVVRERRAVARSAGGEAVGSVVGEPTTACVRTRVAVLDRALVTAVVLVILASLVLLVPGLRERVLPSGWLNGVGDGGRAPDAGNATATASTASGAVNLLQSSEDLADGVWWRPHVAVEASHGDGGQSSVEGSAWSLERTGGGPVDRVQQRVLLEVGERYSFSFEYRAGVGTPGVVAWGTGGNGPYGFVAQESVDDDAPADWSATTTGDMSIDAIAVEDVGADWRQVVVTFHLEAGSTRPVEIGIAPDMRQLVPTAPVVVRAPMLQVGPGPRQYMPTFPPDRAGMRAASAVDTRLRVYREAWTRFLHRPMFGWGPDGFALLRAASSDPVVRAAAHEHSLPLWAALRYGLVGAAAVFVLVLSLYRHRPEQLATVAGVMVANVFDLTFWSSGVALGLALVVGAAPKATGAEPVDSR